MPKRLPPFGKLFLPVLSSGVRVAIGPDAWVFKKLHHYPIMLLPDDGNPDDCTWPSNGSPGSIATALRAAFHDVAELS